MKSRTVFTRRGVSHNCYRRHWFVDPDGCFRPIVRGLRSAERGILNPVLRPARLIRLVAMLRDETLSAYGTVASSGMSQRPIAKKMIRDQVAAA